MIDYLTFHNFYKVDLLKTSNKVSAQPTYIKIDFSHIMIVDILKLATDLFTWHCQLAYLNKILVKQLFTMVTGMEIVYSSDKILPLCKMCIEAKMTCQLY